MAGLNDFLTGTSASTTTMPSWYDTAQQNIVNQATAGAAAMPQLQNTVAGQAINNLSGSNNPFMTAQGQLSQIGAGAVNPWITDASTGQVTPNTQTAMGSLFQAQNQQLNQLLPTTIAPQQAAAIGSGNFGSLRGQTAVDTAKTNALANLQAEQMKAALQNQQTGVSAATGLSGVGTAGTNTMMQTGQAQQAAPLTAVSDLAKIVNSIAAPATVTQSDQLSPLQQMGSLFSGLGTLGTGANSVLGTLFPATGTPGTPGYSPAASLGGLLQSVFKGFGGGGGGTTPLSDQQVSDMISGGGLSSMTLDQLQDLYGGGSLNQDQYVRLVQEMYPPTPDTGGNTDNSGGDIGGGEEDASGWAPF